MRWKFWKRAPKAKPAPESHDIAGYVRAISGMPWEQQAAFMGFALKLRPELAMDKAAQKWMSAHASLLVAHTRRVGFPKFE